MIIYLYVFVLFTSKKELFLRMDSQEAHRGELRTPNEIVRRRTKPRNSNRCRDPPSTKNHHGWWLLILRKIAA